MRVVIADDSTLLREGISQLLQQAGLDVVAVVGDAEALRVAVDRHDPDIAVVDIRMPPTHTDEGLRAAAELRALGTRPSILMLSQWVHAGHALDLFQSGTGGLGYLLKDRITDVDDFLDAIGRVARGGSVIDPEVIGALLRARRGGPLDALTDREREVLTQMAEGRSNAAIADALAVSRKTVETHVNNLFGKLGLASALDDNRRVLAVLAFLRATA